MIKSKRRIRVFFVVLMAMILPGLMLLSACGENAEELAAQAQVSAEELMANILGTWVLTDEEGVFVPALYQPDLFQIFQFAYIITFGDGSFEVETSFVTIEDEDTGLERIIYHYEAMKNLPGRGLYERPADAEFVRAIEVAMLISAEEVHAAMATMGPEAQFASVRIQLSHERGLVRHEIHRIRLSGTFAVVGANLIQLEDELGNTWIFEVERRHRDLTLTIPQHVFAFRLR